MTSGATAWVRLSLGLVAFAAIVVRCPVALGVDAMREGEKRKSVSAAQECSDRLNACARKEAIAVTVRVEPSVPVRVKAHSGAVGDEDVVVGGVSSGLEFRFSRDTGRIQFFANWHANDQCYGEDAPLYDRPTQPAWSKEKVKRVADAWVTALLGSFPKDLALQEIAYDHPYMETPKYCVGTWTVNYARVDDDGHPFREDGVIVQIVERYGPYTIGVQMDSRFEKPRGELLSQEQAITKSGAFAERILRSEVAKRHLHGYVFTGQKTAEMAVVNPNKILEVNDIHEMIDMRRGREARLAWEIRYRLIHKNRKKPGDCVPVEGELSVWIDATTGKFLGGDYR